MILHYLSGVKEEIIKPTTLSLWQPLQVHSLKIDLASVVEGRLEYSHYKETQL